MKLNTLKAKIKRNGLENHAASHFRDEISKIIRSLNEQGEKALVGIEREDGVYTIVGEKYIYYSTVLGDKDKISLGDFSDKLQINGLRKGKGAKYEFLEVDNKKVVWLKNEMTMNALWNLVLWLDELS